MFFVVASLEQEQSYDQTKKKKQQNIADVYNSLVHLEYYAHREYLVGLVIWLHLQLQLHTKS